jgi:hypothetical protein
MAKFKVEIRRHADLETWSVSQRGFSYDEFELFENAVEEALLWGQEAGAKVITIKVKL